MRRGVCVKCGEAQVYKAFVDKWKGGMFLGATKFSGVERDILVCLACGYLEQYATQEGLRIFREHGSQVPPRDS